MFHTSPASIPAFTLWTGTPWCQLTFLSEWIFVGCNGKITWTFVTIVPSWTVIVLFLRTENCGRLSQLVCIVHSRAMLVHIFLCKKGNPRYMPMKAKNPSCKSKLALNLKLETWYNFFKNMSAFLYMPTSIVKFLALTIKFEWICLWNCLFVLERNWKNSSHVGLDTSFWNHESKVEHVKLKPLMMKLKNSERKCSVETKVN